MYPEMGIYRDNMLEIVIGDDLLPIIVIAQTSFDLSIHYYGYRFCNIICYRR